MNVGINFFCGSLENKYSSRCITDDCIFFFRMSPPNMSVTVLCYQTGRLSQNRTVWNGSYLHSTNYFWAKPEDLELVIIQVQWTGRVWSSWCQWRTQEFFRGGGGFNKFSWRQRGRGSGGSSPL